MTHRDSLFYEEPKKRKPQINDIALRYDNERPCGVNKVLRIRSVDEVERRF